MTKIECGAKSGVRLPEDRRQRQKNGEKLWKMHEYEKNFAELFERFGDKKKFWMKICFCWGKTDEKVTKTGKKTEDAQHNLFGKERNL